MLKKHFIAILLLFSNVFAMAQHTQIAVYSGIFSIAGLDYRWYNGKGKPDFAASLALGSVLGIQANAFLIDGKVIFLKKRNIVAGFSLYSHYSRYIGIKSTDSDPEPRVYETKTFVQSLSFPMGYRYQVPNKRFFLEATFSPLNLDWENGRFVGVSNIRSFADLKFGANLYKQNEKGQNIDKSLYFDSDTTQKISVQHSIYLTNPLILGLALGYDARLHGLGKHDFALGLSAYSNFRKQLPDAYSSIYTTMLFGQGNVAFEIGLSLGYVTYLPLHYDSIYDRAFFPFVDNTIIGLPFGFRYQSAKGDIFVKMGAMPYLYLNDQKKFAITQNDEIRTYTYGNDLASQVQAQISLGYSFRKK